MTEGSSKLTVHEFVETLRRGEAGAPLRLTGMAKLPEDGDDPQLMFALGTRCADWTPVPYDSVESVEVKDSVPCDDHSHPLVTLTLKEPDSSEGAMLAGLLRATLKRRGERRAVHHHTPVPTRPGGEAGTLRSACAGACNQYEVFDDGIFELYSCQDYGPGIYVCYYH
jgi:hypothetical protein